MGIEFKVQLREPGMELESNVFADRQKDAATMAMLDWVARGDVGVDQMPLEAIVKAVKYPNEPAKRFRFEQPPVFLVEYEHCCKQCGCSDEDACDPPCSWVTDDVCSNPACVKAAGLS